MSRDEIIAAIQKCAQDLGYVPSRAELLEKTEISIFRLHKNFGSYVNALEACGLERHGCGYKITMSELFMDWALVTRKVSKIPSMLDYAAHGKYTTKALVRHYGGWPRVPAGLLSYAREMNLEDEWQDVMDIAEAALKVALSPERTSAQAKNLLYGRRAAPNQPVYGLPMMTASPLVYAPTNEAGVMVLFGAVAREQGFAITRVQQAFPDCEAMREIEPERCQPTRIEFEYESRNFLLHLHPVDGADLIVCWKHNWPECPLEVLELKTMTWHRRGTKQKLEPQRTQRNTEENQKTLPLINTDSTDQEESTTETRRRIKIGKWGKLKSTAEAQRHIRDRRNRRDRAESP